MRIGKIVRTCSFIFIITMLTLLIGCEKGSQPNASDQNTEVSNEEDASVEVEDVICLGVYEQDNDTDNGSEDIEWIVLAEEDNRALVISKYILDVHVFDDTYLSQTATWETSDLRYWLNDAFINEAFTDEERGHILTVTNPAEVNPNYDTDPGNDTQDQVFVLSISEIQRYFGSDERVNTVLTDYAGRKFGDYHEEIGGTEWRWWERNPGSSRDHVAMVNPETEELTESFAINFQRGGVRPAMWIDLDLLNS